MNWATLQQLIRILLNAGGAMFFGDAIANGELYQAAVGGVISLGAFIWWALAERNKAKQ